jgi:hypothetical protein
LRIFWYWNSREVVFVAEYFLVLSDIELFLFCHRRMIITVHYIRPVFFHVDTLWCIRDIVTLGYSSIWRIHVSLKDWWWTHTNLLRICFYRWLKCTVHILIHDAYIVTLVWGHFKIITRLLIISWKIGSGEVLRYVWTIFVLRNYRVV